MKRLVSLIVAILAMVAILFGVKKISSNKEATEEVEFFFRNNNNCSYLTGGTISIQN